jgi:hypothetical protein
MTPPERTKTEHKIRPGVTGKEAPHEQGISSKQADRAETIADQTVDDQLKETLRAKEYRKEAQPSSQRDSASGPQNVALDVLQRVARHLRRATKFREETP